MVLMMKLAVDEEGTEGQCSPLALAAEWGFFIATGSERVVVLTVGGKQIVLTRIMAIQSVQEVKVLRWLKTVRATQRWVEAKDIRGVIDAASKDRLLTTNAQNYGNAHQKCLQISKNCKLIKLKDLFMLFYKLITVFEFIEK